MRRSHGVHLRQGPGKRAFRGGVLAALVALIALAATPLAGARAAVPPQQLRRGASLESPRLGRADQRNLRRGIPGAGQTPPVSQLHLAMVQGAVYDAVNAIDGGYQPYLADLPPASRSASQEAAVATAAHDVLVGLGNRARTAVATGGPRSARCPLCRRARRHPRRRRQDRGGGSRGRRRSGHARSANE